MARDLATQAGPTVPFVDLAPMHRPLEPAMLDDIAQLFQSGAFTNGPAVAAFEEAFAAYCGADHCIGVASGLDALRLGLVATGIEPGSEVVVPAATFVATLEAVTQAGGVPVVVDVSEDDYCLDPAGVVAAIGSRTHALMPVHLYGQLADMCELHRIADGAGVAIIEDACQAHGATRDGQRAGASGVAAAFSFYPGKNLGGAGDAGALVTRDGEISSRVRVLREHGQTAKYVHACEGWTARLDTIQAIVLLHKLAKLESWNEQRREAAAYYTEALSGLGDLRLPPVPRGSSPVWHLYVVRTGEPDGLAMWLRERGIGTGRHYPEPVHLTGAYARLGYRAGDFPVAEALARECLSLPMYPGITEQQLAKVSDAVRAFFDG
jgi:dTDP-4-amino-4,6-dideoxygalactose transaminase